MLCAFESCLRSVALFTTLCARTPRAQAHLITTVALLETVVRLATCNIAYDAAQLWNMILSRHAHYFGFRTQISVDIRP